MKEEIILSPEGYQNVIEELDRCRIHGRQKASEDLREARSHGDLRENAAYDEAKLNQARLEAHIRDLEYVAKHATIVERPDDAHEFAALGSTITLHDKSYDEEWTFKLVGSFEADALNDRISIVSPVGKAVLGRQKGDMVHVETPGGVVVYEIRGLQ